MRNTADLYRLQRYNDLLAAIPFYSPLTLFYSGVHREVINRISKDIKEFLRKKAHRFLWKQHFGEDLLIQNHIQRKPLQLRHSFNVSDG